MKRMSSPKNENADIIFSHKTAAITHKMAPRSSYFNPQHEVKLFQPLLTSILYVVKVK